jgi:phosphoribosylamine--glycine ligase
MTILLLGSGGREHALAWKMLQSPLCTQLFVAPGNAGTEAIATNVNLNPTDFESIRRFVTEQVTMVVVGPEDPLVAGIYDFFKNDLALQDIPVIGPSQLGAQLEGSKEFAKEFLVKHNIPTAAYDSFTKKLWKKGVVFRNIDTSICFKSRWFGCRKRRFDYSNLKKPKQNCAICCFIKSLARQVLKSLLKNF